MPIVNISSKEIERILKKYGFKIVGQKGSHQQFKGIINGKKRRVTVLKTFESMVRQSGLNKNDFSDL